jgi:class 3 adenylate cyclase
MISEKLFTHSAFMAVVERMGTMNATDLFSQWSRVHIQFVFHLEARLTDPVGDSTFVFCANPEDVDARRALHQALQRLELRGLLDAEWGLSVNNRRAQILSAGVA